MIKDKTSSPFLSFFEKVKYSLIICLKGSFIAILKG